MDRYDIYFNARLQAEECYLSLDQRFLTSSEVQNPTRLICAHFLIISKIQNMYFTDAQNEPRISISFQRTKLDFHTKTITIINIYCKLV